MVVERYIYSYILRGVGVAFIEYNIITYCITRECLKNHSCKL